MYMAKVVRCNLDIQVEIGADTADSLSVGASYDEGVKLQASQEADVRKAWRTFSAPALAVAVEAPSAARMRSMRVPQLLTRAPEACDQHVYASFLHVTTRHPSKPL